MAENKRFSPTVYSTTSFANPSGDEFKTRIGISFAMDKIKLTFGVKNDSSGKFDEFGVAYLTVVKANLLNQAINRVLEGQCDSAGVETNQGYVGVEHKNGSYRLHFVTYDENKVITNHTAYEFKTNYTFIIEGFNGYEVGNKLGGFNLTTIPAEVQVFNITLAEFVKAMTHAHAYSQAVVSQYDGRLNTLFPIARAVNADTKNSYGAVNRPSSAFASDDSSNDSYDYDDDDLGF